LEQTCLVYGEDNILKVALDLSIVGGRGRLKQAQILKALDLFWQKRPKRAILSFTFFTFFTIFTVCLLSVVLWQCSCERLLPYGNRQTSQMKLSGLVEPDLLSSQ
jgi:hypothetical protein